jgi:hypothetical protein
LNVNLNDHDLTQAHRRIQRLVEVFLADGTRLTENLDFS